MLITAAQQHAWMQYHHSKHNLPRINPLLMTAPWTLNMTETPKTAAQHPMHRPISRKVSGCNHAVMKTPPPTILLEQDTAGSAALPSFTLVQWIKYVCWPMFFAAPLI